MRDDHSNWSMALMARNALAVVQDLILIGQTLGLPVAERMYLALAREPLDAQGNRIDWTVIRSRIVQAEPPASPILRREPEGTVLEIATRMAI